MARPYVGWSIVRMFTSLFALVTTVFVGVGPAQAANQVVTDCSDDTQFSSLLAGGGTITFDCGAGPHTILISSQKSINAPTIIDGGGTITLDGQNAYRLFDVGAALTLRQIVLTQGYFNGDGGAIRITDSGTLSLETSTIRDSRATASGGAILSYGPLTITNSVLENNQALNGGALYPRFAGARTMIVGSVLRDNQATDTTNGWGGAILAWDGAPIAIEGSDIYSNTARFGGAIYNYAHSVLTLRSNTRLRYNATALFGGGLYNAGTATLTDVTLSGNAAGEGGGLDNEGMATLDNVTVSGNSSQNVGGGLFNGTNLNSEGTATLTNVTFSGNSAQNVGGGISNLNSTASLTNVTLSGNTAGDGGGIDQDGGSVTVKNTIVANSPSGGNCAGAVISGGFNLASDSSCGFNLAPNLMLGPLANNGGPTLTHMPQPGSPAIDFVAVGCPPPATDQRGAKRPAGAACDAGAVEYGAAVAMVYLPLVMK